ncbi:hypothetical protein EMCRGX_G023610 [Ephydatia muelleri]
MASELISTDISTVSEVVRKVRDGYLTRRTLPRQYREGQLRALQRMLTENKQRWMDAFVKDLNKCEMEVVLMEYGFCLNDITHTLNHLDSWMAPRRVEKDFANQFNDLYTYPEPYGVALVIGAWNYPLQLTVSPLIGAIAAGNACIIKPSELSVAISNLLVELIPQYLDKDCYLVISGGVDVSQAVLKERFDYIFYTGSTPVGKLVMKQAAENLTPVTLELGGKSPCLVLGDANVEVAANRIVWGKCINAGQTCIAPDYILCHREKQDKLVEACKKAITEFYGQDPKGNKDYGKIINRRHFDRLMSLIRSTRGNVVFGGDADEQKLKINPTLITDVTPGDSTMQEEIFGPILPIIAINNMEEAIEIINSREKPLAMYVFSESKRTLNRVIRETSAGGVCHNDTLMHAGAGTLPFGGVGHSGLGAYHGKFSFDTFTHQKPVLSTSTGLEVVNKLVRYPPWTQRKLQILGWVLSPSQKRISFWPYLCLVLLVAGMALAVQTYGFPSWLYKLKPN